MMYWIPTTALSGFLLGAIATATLWSPVRQANLAQKAILDQYLLVNCGYWHPIQQDSLFVAGNAAAMSRTIIAAKLGELGLVEYIKCRIAK